MPRRRTSLLNVSSSCALTSTAGSSDAVAAFAASSLAMVLASTSATLVPSEAANAWSARPTACRSVVKSCSTCSVAPIEATATRSAGAMRLSVHFSAASTARCTSSGCIELVSNSSTHTRWPATSSDVSGTAPLSAATTAGGGAPPPAPGASARPVTTGTAPGSAAAAAAASVRLAAMALAVDVISSKANVTISCGLPSSRRSKSEFCSPRIGEPLLSRTSTSTRMTFTSRRKTGGRPCGGAAAPGCCPETAAPTARTSVTSRARRGWGIAQNLNLAFTVIVRIGANRVTWPNVAELTFVSTAVHWIVLKRLLTLS